MKVSALLLQAQATLLAYYSKTASYLLAPGPYGSPPEPLHYEAMLLVAGGVGVTPVISMLDVGYPLKLHVKLILIWKLKSV